MTAKEYLTQARRLDTQISFDLRELDHWRDLSGRISSCSFEPHYGSGGNKEPPFVRCLGKIVDLEGKIKTEIDLLVGLKSEIMDTIHALDNIDHRSVLELRYFSYWTWEQIAAELHYSVRWIYILHGQALQEIDKKIS